MTSKKNKETAPVVDTPYMSVEIPYNIYGCFLCIHPPKNTRPEDLNMQIERRTQQVPELVKNTPLTLTLTDYSNTDEYPGFVLPCNIEKITCHDDSCQRVDAFIYYSENEHSLFYHLLPVLVTSTTEEDAAVTDSAPTSCIRESIDFRLVVDILPVFALDSNDASFLLTQDEIKSCAFVLRTGKKNKNDATNHVFVTKTANQRQGFLKACWSAILKCDNRECKVHEYFIHDIK